MEYENRSIPEGINVSDTHPLVDFGSLVLGVVLLCGALFGSAYLAAGWLLPHIPFEYEEAMVERFEASGYFDRELEPDEQRAEEALQALAEKLLAGQPLPDGIRIHVHYSNSPEKNAYATLAGHIVIHRGLLDSVDSENALAMVLAHEIGHIVHRDPIMATGRAAVTVTALALMSGFSQSSVADQVASLSAESLLLGFSREQERDADAYALALLQSHYGHLGGADEFFEHMRDEEARLLDDSELLEFFSTHPGVDERIERIEAAQAATDGNLTPLPAALQDIEAGDAGSRGR